MTTARAAQAKLRTMTTQDPYRRPGDVLVNLVETSRDLVHGVAGTRPGSRHRRSFGISRVSRWLGEGVNWLLEEDGERYTPPSPLQEPQPAGHGRSNGRARTRTSQPSGAETSSSNGRSKGRRPLNVIPHPAPPLLQQAIAPSTPHQSLSQQQDQLLHGQGQQDGCGRFMRPRPRSSRHLRS